MKIASTLASCALLVSTAACAPTEPDDGPATSSVARAATTANDTELNGIRVNGIRVNGIRVNGVRVNGIRVNGIRVNGIRVNGIRVNGTALEGVTVEGAQLAGADFAGAELEAVTDDDQTFTVRIEEITRRAAPNDDIWDYLVTYLPENGRPQPLCGRDRGRPLTATVLSGRWNEERGVPGGGAHTDDPNVFTFACSGFVLAKCVDSGYKPWVSAELAAHHQACTRMIRADYCGDGTPHTLDGTLINVYDDLGIELDTESWRFEAEWDASGARCLVETRVARERDVTCVAKTPDCGDLAHFEAGTLLMTELAPHRHR